MLQLTGYYDETQLYFSYEKNCIYKIPKFTRWKYNLSMGMAIVVGGGGVLSGICIYLTHVLSTSFQRTIAMSSGFLLVLVTTIWLRIEYQKRAKDYEYVRQHGICMDDLSMEETYDLVRKESKPVIKGTIVGVFALLFLVGAYVAYLMGYLDGMRIPIACVIGIPTMIIIFCRLAPVRRAKLVRYL